MKAEGNQFSSIAMMFKFSCQRLIWQPIMVIAICSSIDRSSDLITKLIIGGHQLYRVPVSTMNYFEINESVESPPTHLWVPRFCPSNTNMTSELGSGTGMQCWEREIAPLLSPVGRINLMSSRSASGRGSSIPEVIKTIDPRLLTCNYGETERTTTEISVDARHYAGTSAVSNPRRQSEEMKDQDEITWLFTRNNDGSVLTNGNSSKTMADEYPHLHSLSFPQPPATGEISSSRQTPTKSQPVRTQSISPVSSISTLPNSPPVVISRTPQSRRSLLSPAKITPRSPDPLPSTLTNRQRGHHLHNIHPTNSVDLRMSTSRNSTAESTPCTRESRSNLSSPLGSASTAFTPLRTVIHDSVRVERSPPLATVKRRRGGPTKTSASADTNAAGGPRKSGKRVKKGMKREGTVGKRADWREWTREEYEELICMREGRMRWVDIARELGRDVSDVKNTWEGNHDLGVYWDKSKVYHFGEVFT